jgi:lambda family phage tail tape measure protein
MGSLGIAIGAAFSAGSIMSLVEMLDELDKMSEKTGIATESLSALRYAGEVADVSQEKLGLSLKKLAKYMADAAGGNVVAAGAFKTLGVAFADSEGKLRKTDDVLRDMADKFAGWEDGPEKAAIAMRIFGKSGDDMIPMLNMGSFGLKNLADEAKALGAVYGGDVAKNAAEFNDNLKKIKLAAEGTAIALSGPLVKALADASQAFIEAKRNGEGYFGMLARTANWMPQLPDELKNSPAFPLVRIFGMMQQGGAALAAPKQDYSNGSGFPNFGVDDAGGWYSKKRKAPIIKDTSGNKVDHFADNFISQLIAKYNQLSGTMTEVDEVTRKLDISTKKFSATERAEALRWAEKIDMETTKKVLLESEIKYMQEQDAALNKYEETYSRNIVSMLTGNQAQEFEISLLGKNVVEVEKLRQQRELANLVARNEAQVLEQRNAGLLSEIEYRERLAIIQKFAGKSNNAYDILAADKADQTYNPDRGIQEGIKSYMEEISKSGDIMKKSVVGAFSSMEDALVEFVKTGKLDFSSLADSIISDMIRMMIRQSIMKPLMSFFGFADGGIMSSQGPLPLKGYANGGIANSPQLAVFGEGRMNEAFVPLPDGRSIPVSMKGSGQSINITINASVGDIASKGDVVAGMQATAKSIVAQISRSQHYGGTMA